MLISYQALALHLKKNSKTIYVLSGLDHFLLNDAVCQIKASWRERGETDDIIRHINTAADWKQLPIDANSYSLFSEWVLLDIRFDKKTIDLSAKAIITQYIQHPNPRCLMIIQAGLVPIKQWQWLQQNEHVVIVQIVPLSDTALQSWVCQQLKSKAIRHEPLVPALIYQYAQHNMLACAQIIEKLALTNDENHELSVEDVRTQLVDQSDFELYELADACLTANAEKALHLLRQASQTRVEPTLILWLLTQEVRQLIQLSHLVKAQGSFSKACSQLNIWPKRAKGYETTLARVPEAMLYQLIQECMQLDERIKTNQHHHLWHAFETMALSLCLGKR